MIDRNLLVHANFFPFVPCVCRHLLSSPSTAYHSCSLGGWSEYSMRTKNLAGVVSSTSRRRPTRRLGIEREQQTCGGLVYLARALASFWCINYSCACCTASVALYSTSAVYLLYCFDCLSLHKLPSVVQRFRGYCYT